MWYDRIGGNKDLNQGKNKQTEDGENYRCPFDVSRETVQEQYNGENLNSGLILRSKLWEMFTAP